MIGRSPLAALVGLATGCALRLLEPDQALADRLTPADLQFADGSYFREFFFQGKSGDTITAVLASDDFDPMLVLAAWRGATLAENDDAGGDCNARLTHVLPRNGFYVLYATSSSAAELGEFRLELLRGTPPPPPADTVCRGFGPVSGTILPGDVVMGELDSGDPMFGDSTYFESWSLPARAGTRFTVDLESDDFDPYVLLTHGRGVELAADDDGGPGCGARLNHTAVDDRPLRILVTSSNVPPHQTGQYHLRVMRGALPRDSATDCRFGRAVGGRGGPARSIAVGQSTAGELTADDRLLAQDSTHAQWWSVRGTAGRTVVIDLVSEAFDAYLVVLGPGLGTPLEDDDSGGRCHARVTLTFPESGDYEIIVNTAAPRATGRFVLSVRGAAPPPAPGPCPRAD